MGRTGTASNHRVDRVREQCANSNQAVIDRGISKDHEHTGNGQRSKPEKHDRETGDLPEQNRPTLFALRNDVGGQLTKAVEIDGR